MLNNGKETADYDSTLALARGRGQARNRIIVSDTKNANSSFSVMYQLSSALAKYTRDRPMTDCFQMDKEEYYCSETG